LATIVAAKGERRSIAFNVESGCFVHSHAADGVFGHEFRFFHGHAPFMVNSSLRSRAERCIIFWTAG
jgi:hypothetical protein